MKLNHKLMFVLCNKCAKDIDNSDGIDGAIDDVTQCAHSDEERALVGTWTMHEIRKAVEKGYVILDRYELWEYKMATYETGEGLFTDFINTFLKIKQEASGYPSWCKTEDDKDRYIKAYFDREGILLDKSKIVKNEGLRSLAKLMLNSFWGKFGQKENESKTLITRDSEELFKLLVNSAVQVNRVMEVNEEVVVVNWQYTDEVGESLKTVSVVLAAFTTSHARLKLYEHLERLDRQVCYYDTDSVIYYHNPGQYKIPTGDYLGEMTDELEKDYGPGSFITEFVSGGPKTYGYLVYSTNKRQIEEVCKVKGLTLNLRTSKQLNFHSLKRMVLKQNGEEGNEEGEEEMSRMDITESRIRRTANREVITVQETKEFKITGPKRKLDGEHNTLPHGYKQRRIE